MSTKEKGCNQFHLRGLQKNVSENNMKQKCIFKKLTLGETGKKKRMFDFCFSLHKEIQNIT